MNEHWEHFAICIPSHKRVDRMLYKQSTLKQIPDRLRPNTYLCVLPEEKHAYAPVAEKFNVGLITIPNGRPESRPLSRDIIIRKMHQSGYKRIIMMDDDLGLGYRPTMQNIIPQDWDSFRRMIDTLLFHTTATVPIVGVRNRGFANNVTEKITNNGCIIHIYSLHLPTIIDTGFTFYNYIEDMPYMCDYKFILQHLQAGIPNKVLNQFVHGSAQRTSGGCHDYRTADKQSRSAVQLKKMFPNLVRLKAKNHKNYDKPIVDVTISWKKAFNGKQ